jgi:hypothetical protein
MNSSRTLSSSLLASAAMATLLAAGCVSTPPVAENLVVPPMGTVTTFHRKSSGSLGNFDGQVVWTYAQSTFQGKPVIAFSAPQVGASMLDPASLGMLANLNATGQPINSFDPALAYPWPLQVGKTATLKFTVTTYPSGAQLPMSVDFKVESWEEVTVPAGTFMAYRVSSINNFGEAETRWLNPTAGLATLKRHVERPASHPQGAGVLDAVLLSRVLPAK